MYATRIQSLGGKTPWRRTRQSPLVFSPGESHGQRSLAGYSPWGFRGSDTAEAPEHAVCALTFAKRSDVKCSYHTHTGNNNKAEGRGEVCRGRIYLGHRLAMEFTRYAYF